MKHMYSFSCSRPEQRVAVPVGQLQKQTKSAEEKQKELQEEIRKKQEALDQMEVLFHISDSRYQYTFGTVLSGKFLKTRPLE